MPYPLRVRLSISTACVGGRRCWPWSLGRRAPPLRGCAASARAGAGAPVTALVGGTVIDGNGGAPTPDAVVLIAGATHHRGRPARRASRFPRAPRQIDARGQWILPGLIDTNVHLSLYGGQNDRYESLVRYQPRQDEIVLEAAQIDLSYGITTVRDSYGALMPLVQVRDAIARGDKIGARILAAGNILGWSGPYSFSFSRVMGQLTLFQEQMNDFIAQGGGEELMAMTAGRAPPRDQRLSRQGTRFPEVRRHEPFLGADLHRLLGRSAAGDRRGGAPARTRRRNPFDEHRRTPRVDRRRHRRHPAPRAARRPRAAGRPRHRRSAIAASYCSMLASTITGPAWKRHLKTKDEAEKKRAEAEKEGRAPARDKTTAERRKEAAEVGADLEIAAANAQKLIRGGCRVTPGTDSYWAAAPELTRTPKFRRAGPRPRHDHRHRRAGRARDDAVAGDRRRDAQRRDRRARPRRLRHDRGRQARGPA